MIISSYLEGSEEQIKIFIANDKVVEVMKLEGVFFEFMRFLSIPSYAVLVPSMFWLNWQMSDGCADAHERDTVGFGWDKSRLILPEESFEHQIYRELREKLEG